MDPAALMNWMEGQHMRVDLGAKTVEGGTARWSPDNLRRWIEAIYQETLYYCVVHSLQEDYVGKGMATDLATRLVMIKQVGTAGGYLPVSEYHQQFSTIITQMPQAALFPIDVVRTNGLNEQLKTKLNILGYRIPPQAQDNAVSSQQLTQLYSRAQVAEKDLELMTHFNPRKRGPSVMTLTTYGDKDDAVGTIETNYNIEHLFEDTPAQYHPQAMAVIFNSVAETALRHTSGSNAPRECFGCKDHPNPEIHTHRFSHLWADCPNKHLMETWATYRRRFNRGKGSEATYNNRFNRSMQRFQNRYDGG